MEFVLQMLCLCWCIAEAAQVGTPPPPLQLKGAKLVDAVNGTDVMLHGINWWVIQIA